MKKIWKFEMCVGANAHMQIHPEARVVAVAALGADNRVTFWIELPFDSEFDTHWPARQFAIVATGQSIGENFSYQGTAIWGGGALVWHLYEILG